MIVGKAIYHLLTNATGVTDIVSTRIYPEVAHQDAQLPFIVYNIANNEPTDTKPEPSKLDTAQIEVNIYSQSYTQCIDLAVAVRAALDRVKGTYNGVNVQSIQYLNEIIDFDEPQRTYNIAADYDVRISRTDFEIAQGSPITGVELGALSDVNVAGVTDNQILSYDAATDTWVPAADAGGAEVLNDLTDVQIISPEQGDVLSYNSGVQKWMVNGGLQQLLAKFKASASGAQMFDTLNDTTKGYIDLLATSATMKVNVTGIEISEASPGVLTFSVAAGTEGNEVEFDAMVITGSSSLATVAEAVFKNGTLTYFENSTGRIWLRVPNAGNLTVILPSSSGTLALTSQALPVGGATGQALVKSSGTNYDVEWADISVDVQYHDRYQSAAASFRSGATATTEIYYSAIADGDGYAESASTDTPTTGYDIRRKLYYSEAGFANPDTGTWIQFAAIADNTTFANAKAALLAYLKERTGGTVPISLKQTWEEVAQAPAFTGLLNESYGSGAAAAYSVRRLNGNYTGAALQVERSSDNTTQDIGFDANGDLDESALTTFCTGTVCKVRTWYDQSVTGGTGSGNDAVQTDHALQPTIYTGGAIVKENGRVAVDFNKANSEHFEFTSADFAGDYIDLFLTGLIDTYSSNGSMLLGSTTGGATYWQHGNTDGYFVQGAGGGTAIAVNNSTRYLFNQFSNSTSINVHLSGADFSDSFAVSAIPSGSRTYLLGKYPTGTNWNYDGKMQEFVAYPSQRTTGNRTSIESNIGDYFTQNTPLLDTYTGAAAAYSLRKLRSAYNGSAIRVRRASDNTEQDIGFNVFGELDTVSLASFCSGTNGFVAKWYDQSSNANDATQSTTGSQPKIYDGTTGVVTDNSKPALDFDGSDDVLSLSSYPFTGTNLTVFATGKQETTSEGILYNFADSNNAFSMSFNRTANTYTSKARIGATNLNAGDTDDQTRGLYTQIVATSTSEAYKNGTQGTQNINGRSLFSVNEIGSRGSTEFLNGTVQELIAYDSDQSANRTNIEDNINTFYSIY